MRVNRIKRVLILLVMAVPLLVFAADAPSLELLEFLGNWETSDGEWQDPLELMQELDALEDGSQSAKVEDEQDAQ